MFMCLHIAYGCIYTRTAGLSNYNRDCMVPKVFTVWVFTERFAGPYSRYYQSAQTEPVEEALEVGVVKPKLC